MENYCHRESHFDCLLSSRYSKTPGLGTGLREDETEIPTRTLSPSRLVVSNKGTGVPRKVPTCVLSRLRYSELRTLNRPK